jgi:hypothetical protein
VKKGKENLEKHVLIHCINLLKRDPPHTIDHDNRYIIVPAMIQYIQYRSFPKKKQRITGQSKF